VSIKIKINQPKAFGRFVSIECTKCGSKTKLGFLTLIRIFRRIDKFMNKHGNDDIKELHEIINLRKFGVTIDAEEYEDAPSKKSGSRGSELMDADLAFKCRHCGESFEISATMDEDFLSKYE
jgi:hypothetical protein